VRLSTFLLGFISKATGIDQQQYQQMQVEYQQLVAQPSLPLETHS